MHIFLEVSILSDFKKLKNIIGHLISIATVDSMSLEVMLFIFHAIHWNYQYRGRGIQIIYFPPKLKS